MFKIYWSEKNGYGQIHPHSRDFPATEMKEALAFMELLRKGRRDDQRPVTHITMVSENPESVGEPGVAETGPGYRDQWNKDHRGSGPEEGVIYRIK